MSTDNTELSKQSDVRKGRNPAILAGGLILLAAAFAFLIFQGAIFSDAQTPNQAAVAPDQAGEVDLPRSGPPLQEGDTPYEFALEDVDGEVVTLSQFIGRPILINFWATWCGPCRIEMPEIQAIWEAYEDDGLVVLALDQDETADQVDAYFNELGLTFTPLLDDGFATAQNYGLKGTLPSSVFISPEGEVTVIHRGIMTRGQLESFLAETMPDKTNS